MITDHNKRIEKLEEQTKALTQLNKQKNRQSIDLYENIIHINNSNGKDTDNVIDKTCLPDITNDELVNKTMVEFNYSNKSHSFKHAIVPMKEYEYNINKCSKEYARKIQTILEEIKKKIVGQEDILKKLLISIISRGHTLLEGPPGLAKTLMIKTIASTLNVNFSRIQFTPDLLPADITGTKIYNHESKSFETQKGPIFNNFILIDEINRAPAKVQSALLECMQEKQVSILGDTHVLEKPFFVLATQNPIEQEGTYKLPEAQLDRFAFKLLIRHPTKNEQKKMLSMYTEGIEPKIKMILTSQEILEIQEFADQIFVSDAIKEYVTSIVDTTSNMDKYTLLDEKNLVEFGASPRASITFIQSAKVCALMNGRGYVIPDDVKYIAYDILRHRIGLTFEAEINNVTSDKIIEKILVTLKGY